MNSHRSFFFGKSLYIPAIITLLMIFCHILGAAPQKKAPVDPARDGQAHISRAKKIPEKIKTRILPEKLKVQPLLPRTPYGAEKPTDQESCGCGSTELAEVQDSSETIVKSIPEQIVFDNDANAPEHDLCTNAIEVQVGFIYLGSTIGATGEITLSCSDYDYKDVWHVFTPTQSGTVTFSLMRSSFDTTLAIYDTCGSTELVCNDDAMGTLQSEIQMSVDAGTPYLIRIAGYFFQTGDYALNIHYPPEHDECNNAIEVYTGKSYYGTTQGATGVAMSSCCDSDNRDVWHIFTPTQSGKLLFSLLDSCFDTTLAIFNGCDGSELTSNDNAGYYGQSMISMEVQAGEIYYIRVAGANDATGNYVLTIDNQLTDLSPPENDECSDAIEVYKDTPYNGSTIGATGLNESSCGIYDFYDVWHIFTPEQSEMVKISLMGSDFDTTLAIYDQCDGMELACNDQALGTNQSEIIMEVEAGVSYYIRIAGYYSEWGNYLLTITSYTPPANDNCEDAIEVLEGVPYQGNTFGATGESSSSCSYLDDLDVWHVYTPTQSGEVTISLADSDFDTTLAVYGFCDGKELACNDDTGWWYYSEITMYMEGGISYLIRVAGFYHDAGNYVLTVGGDTGTDIPDITPENDECENAIEVYKDTPYNGSTIGATGYDWSECGGYYDELDVWHIFKPEQSEMVKISLMGSDFDTTLAIYDECYGTELACNDDTANTLQSEIYMQVEAGVSYMIRIAGYDDETGNYVLTITTHIPPENDECINAIEIQEGVPYYGSSIGATGDSSSTCGFYDYDYYYFYAVDDLDVWHSFTPAKSGIYTIRLYADFDTTVAVYDQCEGTELACNDETCMINNSEIIIHMLENTTYLIRVAGFDSQTGDYMIEVLADPLSIVDEPYNPYPADGVLNVSVDTILSWNEMTEQIIETQDTINSNESIVKSEQPVEIIYGDDDRMEEYQVNNPSLLAAGDATVILVPLSQLTTNSDGSYNLPDQTFGEWYEENYGYSLCPDEPYTDQPAPGFCSGFLVAPDIIATAGHCAYCPCELSYMAVIFGFVMHDEETPSLVIPAQDVYFVQDVINNQMELPDCALLRLDRKVTGHTPLPIRHTGKINDDQSLVLISYPMGIPRKYDWGGKVYDNTPATYFAANVDAYPGSSGGVVLNRNILTVEGILVRGPESFETDWFEDCDRSIIVPDDEGYDGYWIEATRITALSSLIPTYDVYLGIDPDNLVLTQSYTVLSEFEPESLQPLTTYYWQITARGASGETAGPIWQFTTE